MFGVLRQIEIIIVLNSHIRPGVTRKLSEFSHVSISLAHEKFIPCGSGTVGSLIRPSSYNLPSTRWTGRGTQEGHVRPNKYPSSPGLQQLVQGCCFNQSESLSEYLARQDYWTKPLFSAGYLAVRIKIGTTKGHLCTWEKPF